MDGVEMAGVLYLVGTPIGNLEDISLRALAVLRSVDVIAAEDTRQTLKLFHRFGLTAELLSYHRHNEDRRLPEILSLLAAGRKVAVVTDAGMPGIADPGEKIVRAARQAGYPVVPIPGPSACLLALAASGLPSGEFHFAGFLPRRGKARKEALLRLADEEATLILYEAPHRLVETLADLAAVLGTEREVVVARELTKLHEEFWQGTLAEASAHFATHPARGEITLVIAGKKATSPGTALPIEAALARLEERRQAGVGLREALRQVARETGWPKNELYRRYLAEKKRPED